MLQPVLNYLDVIVLGLLHCSKFGNRVPKVPLLVRPEPRPKLPVPDNPDVAASGHRTKLLVKTDPSEPVLDAFNCQLHVLTGFRTSSRFFPACKFTWVFRVKEETVRVSRTDNLPTMPMFFAS